MQLHSISSHGEEYGHAQAETLLVTDSQSENEGKREKREKKDSIVQTLGKVTVCPSKDQVQVSGETNSKTSRQTLAKQTEPHVWVCTQKPTKKSIFLQICMSLGKFVGQGDNKLGFVLFSL